MVATSVKKGNFRSKLCTLGQIVTVFCQKVVVTNGPFENAAVNPNEIPLCCAQRAKYQTFDKFEFAPLQLFVRQ
jgi:hypothetical protein